MRRRVVRFDMHKPCSPHRLPRAQSLRIDDYQRAAVSPRGSWMRRRGVDTPVSILFLATCVATIGAEPERLQPVPEKAKAEPTKKASKHAQQASRDRQLGCTTPAHRAGCASTCALPHNVLVNSVHEPCSNRSSGNLVKDCRVSKNVLPGFCLLELARRGTCATPAHQATRAAYVRALRGHHVVISGDSMARQAFYTLVARLRGETCVADPFNSNASAASYVLRLAANASMLRGDDDEADLLTMLPGFDFVNALVPKEARAHVLAGAQADTISIEYFGAPCMTHAVNASARVRASPLLARRRASALSPSLLVLFQPSYWLLLPGHNHVPCEDMSAVIKHAPPAGWLVPGPGDGHTKAAHTPGTPPRGEDALSQFYQLWDEAARALGVRHVALVTAPEENVPQRLKPYQLQYLNRKLRAAFGVSSPPRSRPRKEQHPQWSLADFAALTEASRPPNLVGLNWHYVCTLYGDLNVSHSRPAHSQIPAKLLLVERVDQPDAAKCGEAANTLLWERLLLPLVTTEASRGTNSG